MSDLAALLTVPGVPPSVESLVNSY